MTQPSASPTRWFNALIRLLIGIILIVAIFTTLGPTWHEVRVYWRWDGSALAWAWLASASTAVATAARWKILAESVGGTALPYSHYLHHLVVSRLLSQVLPSTIVDVVVRTAGLRRSGSQDSVTRIATTIVVERSLDVLMPVALLVWAWTWAHPLSPRDHTLVAFAVTVGLVAFVIFLTLQPVLTLATRIGRWLQRSNPKPIGGVVRLGLRTRGAIVILGVTRYLLLTVQYFAMGAAMGVVLAPLDLLASTPLGQLAAFVSITPGGLGFHEGSWAASLAWRGLHPAKIALFLIATRLGLIVNFSVLSLCTLVWTTIKSRVGFLEVPVDDSVSQIDDRQRS